MDRQSEKVRCCSLTPSTCPLLGARCSAIFAVLFALVRSLSKSLKSETRVVFLQGLRALDGKRCSFHVLCVLKQRCEGLKSCLSKQRGISSSYSKGTWGPVFPQAVGGKSETPEAFPLLWNVNGEVWSDSNLLVFWVMLQWYVPSRVLSFISLTLGILFFYALGISL